MRPDPAGDGATPRPGRWSRLAAFLARRRGRARHDEEALRLPPMTRGMLAFSLATFFALGAAMGWFVVANPFGVGLATPRAPGAMRSDHRAADGAVFQCPMHPQVVEAEPGTCPICGMVLVEVQDTRAGPGHRGSAGSGERRILYWYAPMDPTYIRDEPGVSPMGMQLVPKYADEAEGAEPGVIRIDPVQVQNTGVVSTKAEIADIARYSRTIGILDFNADNITWINVKFEGWIEKVHVNYVGEPVKKGQPLFEIYSPVLVTTQEEYLRALGYRASLEGSDRAGARRQAENLVRSTRDRLKYWDITDEQIEHLESSGQVQRRLTVTSPANGVVAQVMSEALEGMFVKPGMDLYKIADLSTVWVHADIYELDIPWIRKEQPAVVSFRNAPEQLFRGKVLFLYPEVSRDTRTLKICVEVPNPNRRLRPGMYADVIVQGPLVQNAVVVPQSAIIRSGERNVVFVSLGGGRFQPREVDVGVTGEGDRVQIVSGIAAGEEIVIQGQFMLDSESRIEEAIAQFREGSASRAGSGTAPSPAPPAD